MCRRSSHVASGDAVRTKPPPSKLLRESAVLRDVVQLYMTLGCQVCCFQEGRRTRVTPGWPDLAVFCPAKACFWLHEVKAPGGTQSVQQYELHRLAEQCHVDYVLGGAKEAEEHLRFLGVIVS